MARLGHVGLAAASWRPRQQSQPSVARLAVGSQSA